MAAINNTGRYDSYVDNELARVEVQTSTFALYVLRIVRFKSQTWVDLRKWIRWKKEGEFHPSKSGVFVRSEIFRSDIFPALAQMLGQMEGTSSTVESTDGLSVGRGLCKQCAKAIEPVNPEQEPPAPGVGSST